MEAKTLVFWGENDSHKVSTNVHSDLFFSFFRLPKKVQDMLVRIQRRFLWGGDQEQTKIAWVK